MLPIAFLGPQGTFAEQAARTFAGAELDSYEFVPARTVSLALGAVRDGEVELACVPVENSVEGAVGTTMDGLAVGAPLEAVAEVLLPIRFSVLVRPGTPAAKVRTVASHPHALAQVQTWLEEHLPDAEAQAATSTAAAAVGVAKGEFDAAVTAPVAAVHYPLEEFATGVADVGDAVTRFFVLARPGRTPAPTGADRTSVVAVAERNRTGVLAEMLTELALRGINLSRIESRPLKGRFGEYRFYLDFDGHLAEQRVGDALAALHRRCRDLRFLGSYPRADRGVTSAEPGNTDADYVAAAGWLAGLRDDQARLASTGTRSNSKPNSDR
ncbi:prephenate dehydratase [Actinophytocola sp.]|uniref:prephenate dehydratase n=1 Tax=Actinophytocola sp. TaxID=1872138 RepID=UPI002D7F5BB9|nr:prephenate dehydratase [Actinophytocola sp.]HET9142734.1 prephenate dehydratase [Actinophytocola sp.]